MCTVLLPPGLHPIAVNKYIVYHIISYIISYRIISYHNVSYIISYHRFAFVVCTRRLYPLNPFDCGNILTSSSDLLRTGLSKDRISVQARYSSHVQTGPGSHPASYTRGTASFPVVKLPGPGIDHPPKSNAEVKERVQFYLYSPSVISWQVTGLTLLL